MSENNAPRLRARFRRRAVLLPLALLALPACGTDEGSSAETGDDSGSPTQDVGAGTDGTPGDNDLGVVETGLTWNDDIGPLLQNQCGGCHTEGGAGQFDLLSYESAADFAPVALSAMQSGRMPPWPAADDCRDYVGERRIPAEDIARFEEWMQGGMPVGEGEARVFTAPELESLRADLTARMTEPYTPVASLNDDYRCFVLDLEFPEDTWVEGVDVDPGSAQVHHVLIYAMEAEALQAALDADVAEEGPGYTCFGGPNPSRGQSEGPGRSGADFPIQVGAWVPGMTGRPLPDGSAMRVPGSSRLIMQVHYNTIGGPVVPDSTSIVVQTRPDPPAFTWRTAPIVQRDLSIAAGDAASVQTATIRNNGTTPITIASAAHHMHTLGTSIRGTIVRADGAEECLLDVPNWDFQWQLQYFFESGTFAVVEPGDSIRLDCTYDNSAANQPVVDGVQQAPRPVSWGEGRSMRCA